MLLWLAVASRFQLTQALAGLVAAAAATALAGYARRQMGIEVHAPTGALRVLASVPAGVVRDLLTLSREALARSRGRPSAADVVAVPVGEAVGEHGYVTLGVVAVTLTPNTLAIGIDPDEQVLVVHRLRGGGDPEDDVHPRLP